MNELQLICDSNFIDVVLITEVKAKNTLEEPSVTQFNLEGYNIYSNLDDTNSNRGVNVYINQSLCTNITVNQWNHEPEGVHLSIKLDSNDKLELCCVYRSPSNKSRNGNSVFSLINHLTEMASSHLLIAGDINSPNVNWSDWTATDADGQLLIDTLRDNYLHQHIVNPTRYRNGTQPTCIDLVMTNEEGMVNDIAYLPGIGLSDHVCLMFNFTVYVPPATDTEKPRYHIGDYKAINQEIERHNWTNELANLSTSEAMNLVIRCLKDACDKHIPVRRHKRRRKRQLWMTNEALSKQRKKKEAWKKYLRTHDHLDYIRATKEKLELRQLTRNLCTNFEKDLAYNIKKEPKAFWRYVNSKMKSRQTINDLVDPSGTLIHGNEEKANLLNDYFSSVFTREDTSNVPTPKTHPAGQEVTTMVITQEKVQKKLAKLKTSKTPGPDGLHPRVLQETSNSLSKPLSIIFNKSISEGELPDSWKIANVHAIHKKGDKSQPSNYRPISLTSIVGKTLESLVRDEIVNHMSSAGLFCDAQHGFVPGRSCATQLLVVLEHWTKALDQGLPIDAIYLDFKKAFDSVPHERLLVKLKSYGIQGPLLDWIRVFLTGRRQRVVINGSYSSWTEVVSGIPQGSVLGPTLFVCFINDLPTVVTSTIQIFADDTKIYRALQDQDDQKKLQKDLDALKSWSTKWQLHFNDSKCKVLHLGNQNPRHTYHMGGTILQPTKLEKDLGVYVDEELKFHQHVRLSVKKANRILGLIRHTFNNLDETSLPLLYKSLVRPHLEYANTIWHPRFAMDREEIEKVQHRATKLIPQISHLPYDQRLEYLGLPSLQYRRIRADLIQTYKIFTKQERLDPAIFFVPHQYSSTRGHSKKLQKPRSNTNLRLHSFSNRIVNTWNSLPQEIIDSSSLNVFKSQIDHHFATQRYAY